MSELIARSKDAISSLAGRVFLGLIAMATVIAGLPLKEGLEFDLTKALGAAAAAAAWLAAEWLSWERRPHEHDIELRRAVFALANPVMPFLRDHDLGGSFQWARLNGLIELHEEYIGARFQFIDPKLQRRWQEAQKTLGEFIYFTAHKSYPTEGGNGFNSFLTGRDASGLISKEAQGNIDKANQLATDLYNRFEALEELSLRRLGVSAVRQGG
ncbi:MAG: hypothetical protein AAFR88_01065 [Pseudomonadota bacterium]